MTLRRFGHLAAFPTCIAIGLMTCAISTAPDVIKAVGMVGWVFAGVMLARALK